MTEAAFWWVHTGSIETYQGSGPSGPVYASAVDVACWVEGETKQITNSQGAEVTSTSVVRGPLTDKDLFKAGSRFTYAGSTSTVTTLAWFDSGSLDIGLDHYEARLS